MKHDPFDPLVIGPSTVPNRIFMAPVKTALGPPDGKVSDRHVAYYRRRAAGGTGTVIVEPMFVDPVGKEHPKQLGIDDDDKVSGLSRLVGVIHEAGAHAVAHINHAGRAANPKASGLPTEAPSAVACPSTGATPQALTAERIEQVIHRFGDAARRAAEAGFDGIELQLGLGYLVAQFLSPRTNHRDDEYAAVGEDRFRFAQRVVRAVREAIGPGRYLIARLSAEERVPGGLGLDDAIELAKRARQWGADAIHVVTGSACDSPPWYYQHMSLPEQVNETLAGQIRQKAGAPVIVAGRLGDPDRIRSLVGEGQVDAIALGRALLADPDLPAKMREGKDDTIQLCGGCLQGCLAKVKEGGPIGCIVNPEIGREADSAVPRRTKKHVVVVGGGPAGLQAALSASERGHRVTLLEKEDLGGQFAHAPLAPGKQGMQRTFESLLRRARQSGIDLRTGVAASADDVIALQPDEVVVATGSQPVRLRIEGLEHALSGADVLARRATVGTRALVIGGGMVGIETAEHLGLDGVETVVVEALEDVARDMELVTRKLTMKRLEQLPVTVFTRTKVTAVRQGTVFVSGPEGAERELGRFDSVVVAVGHRSVDVLSEQLRARGASVHVVGDAAHPGQIWDATQAGAAAARTF